MSEIATLKRMAASDEYSATETAIFDGAANELYAAKQHIAKLKAALREIIDVGDAAKPGQIEWIARNALT